MKTLKLQRPSDFHTHLRSPAQVGEKLFRMIVALNCAHYRYVVVEPNTYLDKNKPERHIETADDLVKYRKLVSAALPEQDPSTPLFLIKLTPKTTPRIIRDADDAGCIGVKLYPEGVTTGSQHGGVSDFHSKQLYRCLEYLEEQDLVFQIHPEMPKTFCLEREHSFHDVLTEYAKRFPKLRIFVEHITDRRTLELVQELRHDQGARVYGTITGHHLRLTLDNVLGQVDHHCWPCAKFPEDRDALVSWALPRSSCGVEKFLISITDSAPHEWQTKHGVSCACAGVFNPAHIAIPWLVTLAHERKTPTETLETFWAFNGMKAYQLKPLSKYLITLVQKPWVVPGSFGTGHGCYSGEKITPFLARETLPWQIATT